MITLLYYNIIVLIACLFDCLIACLFNWLTVLLLFLVDCLIVWLFDCLIVWVLDCFIIWLFDWLIVLIVWARGPWGPLGSSKRIHLESVTTYSEAGYLLSGRLSAVSDMHPKGVYFAPKRFQILCTQQFPHTCTQQPHTCTQPFPRTCTQKAQTLHPKVSAYMHPNPRVFQNLKKM